MFCSNCGKEIAEGSAFCSGCGKATRNGQSTAAPVQQVMYVNQVKKNTIAGTAEEIKKKMAVLGMYIGGALMQIIMFLVVLTSKLGIITEFFVIENPMIGNELENAIKQGFEELQVIIWFAFILILSATVSGGFLLWRRCVDRCLTDTKKDIIMDSILTAMCCFGLTVVFCMIALQSPNEVSISFLYWIVLFGFIMFKAIYTMTYLSAIKLETINVYRENTLAASVNN